jgi:hypothetical protein
VFFPYGKYTPEDPASWREKRKDGMIRSMQDNLSCMASESGAKDREIGRQKLSNGRLTKENKALKKKVASLEFALREANSRNKRRR